MRCKKHFDMKILINLLELSFWKWQKELLQNLELLEFVDFGREIISSLFILLIHPLESFGSDSLGPSHVVLVLCDIDM